MCPGSRPQTARFDETFRIPISTSSEAAQQRRRTTFRIGSIVSVDIPTRSFFRFCAPCRPVSTPPTIDGDLGDWDDGHRLPDLSEVSGEESVAAVYAAWDADGLYFAVSARARAAASVDVGRPLRGDGFQIWLDTRDVREAHRASRYCHHFYFLPGKGRRKPRAGQMRIRRARAHGRICDPDELSVGTHFGRSDFALEIHIPAAAMTGFEPTENRRLGFSYLLKDAGLGRQTWTADDPLPVAYDPSLWGTLELVDG